MASGSNVDGGMKVIKMLMILFNFLFFLVGMLLIICGALIMTKFKEYSVGLGGSFDTAPIVIIIVGFVVFSVAFLGCCGAWKENRCMITAFSALMIILLLLQVTAVIAAYVMKSKVKEVITPKLQEALFKSNTTSQSLSFFNLIQTRFECCGVKGPGDWNSAIPQSCCNSTDTCSISNAYEKGCLEKFDRWIESNVAIVASVALAVCFVQLIGIICGCCLVRGIKNDYESMH